MRQLVLLNGVRDPRRHCMWLARTQPMFMRARTIPQTTEYGRSQRFAKCIANYLSRSLASKPKRPSAEIRNGEKERRCWKHSSRYFFFFFFFYSWFARTLAGSLVIAVIIAKYSNDCNYLQFICLEPWQRPKKLRKTKKIWICRGNSICLRLDNNVWLFPLLRRDGVAWRTVALSPFCTYYDLGFFAFIVVPYTRVDLWSVVEMDRKGANEGKGFSVLSLVQLKCIIPRINPMNDSELIYDIEN